MAACTSRAAASILRLRSNCSVMLVEPRVLDEVISVTPAMRPNWRSSGVATEEAMVSGLAPGRLALTEMVGKSTCGSGDDRQKWKATRRPERDGDGEQRGGDGPADEGVGDVHAVLRIRLAGLGWIEFGSAGAVCGRSAAARRSKAR